jgi:hypothetical protein
MLAQCTLKKDDEAHEPVYSKTSGPTQTQKRKRSSPADIPDNQALCFSRYLKDNP